MKHSVGVVVVTHNAKKHLPHCLPPLLNSSLKPRVLVINSSSQDGTVELAKDLGAETLTIARADFNHGSTRETARQYLRTDFVVMITPDAYFVSADGLDHLVDPLLQKKATISYARQIPHDGADFFERFPRDYNYPQDSHVRGIEDTRKYGVYTFFCSNSCAAYANRALDEIGGFPSVLLGEDTYVVAQLLRRGHKIAYVAESIVKHSHRYTLLEEFRRSFDTGLARREYASLLECEGTDTKRGMGYFKEMSKQLLRDKPHLLPYAFSHTLVKWLGYQLGRTSLNAPIWLKKKFSSQDFYWSSNDFLGKS